MHVKSFFLQFLSSLKVRQPNNVITIGNNIFKDFTYQFYA